MKKLLSLLSIILVTSSASSSIQASHLNNISNEHSIDSSNPLLKGDEEDTIDYWDQKNQEVWLGYAKESYFKLDKAGDPIKDNMDFQLNYNKQITGNHKLTPTKIVDFSIKSIIGRNGEDYSKYFTIRRTAADSSAGINKYKVLLNSNIDKLPAVSTDLIMTFSMKSTIGLIGLIENDDTYIVTASLTNEHDPLKPKTELKDLNNGPILELNGELETTLIDTDQSKLINEITAKINDELPELKGDFNYKVKPSFDDTSAIIYVPDTNKEYVGSLVVRYEFGKPKKILPENGIIDLGTIIGTDKYKVTKDISLLSFSYLSNQLRDYYKNNLPEAYSRGDFDALTVLDGININPNTTSKKYKVVTKTPEINGEFEARFNIAFASVKDTVKNVDLGLIPGVNTLSSKEEIEKEILKIFEDKNPDFKGMFGVKVEDIGTSGQAEIYALNLSDSEKQIFNASDSTNVNFTLDTKDISDIIDIDEVKASDIPSTHFLDDPDSIGHDILEFITKKYSLLDGSIDISQTSIDKIDPTDSSTWKVDIVTKEGEGLVGGHKEIKFDVNPTELDKLEPSIAKIDVSDKFMIADLESVKQHLKEGFEKNNPRLKGLVQVEESSLNFDAANPDTWNFKIKAIDSHFKYLLGISDKIQFELSSASLTDIFGSDSISMPTSVGNSTTSDSEVADTILNTILTKEEDTTIYRPELKGMIKVEMEDKGISLDKSAKIIVDEDYKYAKYLNGEVSVSAKIVKADINDIISTNDITKALYALGTDVDNEEIAKKTISELVINNSKGWLSTGQFSVSVSGSVSSQKFHVIIEITDDSALYVGKIDNNEIKIVPKDINEIVSASDLSGLELNYLDYISMDEETAKEEFKNTILEAHKNDDQDSIFALKDKEFTIDYISYNEASDPLNVKIMVSAASNSTVLTGSVELEFKLKSVSLLDTNVITNDLVKSINVNILNIDETDTITNEAIEILNKFNAKLAERVNVTFDKKTKKINIIAKEQYSAGITDSVSLEVSFDTLSINDLFSGIVDGKISLGNVDYLNDKLNIDSTEDDIKTAISDVLKNNLKEKHPEYTAKEIDKAISLLSLNYEGYDFVNSDAVGKISVTPSEETAGDLVGELEITFVLAKIDISKYITEDVIKVTETNWLDYVNDGNTGADEVMSIILKKYPSLKDQISILSIEKNDAATGGVQEKFTLKVTSDDNRLFYGKKIINVTLARIDISELFKDNNGNMISIPLSLSPNSDKYTIARIFYAVVKNYFNERIVEGLEKAGMNNKDIDIMGNNGMISTSLKIATVHMLRGDNDLIGGEVDVPYHFV